MGYIIPKSISHQSIGSPEYAKLQQLHPGLLLLFPSIALDANHHGHSSDMRTLTRLLIRCIKFVSEISTKENIDKNVWTTKYLKSTFRTFVCPPVCLLVCISVCIYIYPSIHLSIQPSNHPSVRLSIIPSFHTSNNPSI